MSKDDLYQLALESARIKRVPLNQGAVVLVVHPENAAYAALMQKVGQRVAPTAFPDQYITTSIEDARKFLTEHYGIEYVSAGD